LDLRREYLAFNADVYKVAKKRIEVIALTGLTAESNKKIGQLSKDTDKGRISKCAASQS
jgi:ABC-type multidrug transport system ATPase subunit